MGNNIYTDPEKFGLTVVADLEAEGGYAYDKFIVWRNPAGHLLWDDESGCSCPVPFEDKGLDDLKDAKDAEEVLRYFDQWVADAYHPPTSGRGALRSDLVAALAVPVG